MDKHSRISKELFKVILQDSEVTKPDYLKLLQTIYFSPEHEATSTDLAEKLGYKDKIVVNGIVGKFGKQIAEKYNIKIGDDSFKYWDLFFDGYKIDTFFHWKLKRELQKAMEELLLTINPPQIEKAFLFTFNSDIKNWTNLEESFEDFNLHGKCWLTWRCKNNSVREGDRAFLVKIGKNPKGIIGSGIVTTIPIGYVDEKYQNKYYIQIQFTTLLDWRKENILTIEDLKINEKLAKQNWTPQASGISIRPELVEELETTWSNFLVAQNIKYTPAILKESEIQTIFTEGTAKEVKLTRYERDKNARSECIKHYGYACSICSFDFEKHYGQIGKNFIHVHHLTEIASIGKKHQIDPIKDLRPVCPNCHAMIHSRKPALSIEELKKHIQ